MLTVHERLTALGLLLHLPRRCALARRVAVRLDCRHNPPEAPLQTTVQASTSAETTVCAARFVHLADPSTRKGQLVPIEIPYVDHRVRRASDLLQTPLSKLSRQKIPPQDTLVVPGQSR